MLQSEAMTFWKTNIRKSLKEQPDKDALEQQMVLLREKIDKKKRKSSIKLCFLKQNLSSSSYTTASINSDDSVKERLSSVFDTIKDIEAPDIINVEADDNNNPANLGEETFETYIVNSGALGDETEDITEDAEDVNVIVNTLSDKNDSDQNTNLALPCLDEEKPDKPAPKQESLQGSLSSVNSQLLQLHDTSRLPLLDNEMRNMVKSKIVQAGKLKKTLEKKLKQAKQNQKHSKLYRVKKKKAIVRAIQLYPQVAPILKGFSKDLPGNPRIECDQPNILEQILKIAEIGAACSDRRRDNTVRTVRTLDQLKLELDKLGFQVSRSGIYLKLLPRDPKSIEGRRHVSTVPVKLTKPQNNLRKGHKDRIFARETCFAVDKIAATLGPEACTFLSQDD